MSSMDDWCSPPEVTVPMVQVFQGPVGLDPCSNERSLVFARRCYRGKVALLLPWDDESNYENPPYSELPSFTAKGLREIVRVDHTTDLLRLVPAATSTGWWRLAVGAEPLLVGRREVRARKPLVIFTKRLSFIGTNGRKQTSARFDCALILHTTKTSLRRRALREFSAITSWTSGAAS
jgi:hypothetical protein